MDNNDEINGKIGEIFKSLIEPREYTGKPIPLNRFSIGSLSFDPEKEIQRKLGIIEETPKDRLNMFKGSALHNYIQEKVKKMGFEPEHRLYYSLPHHWEYMGFNDITLVGVIDLISNEKNIMVELKSSTSSDRIEEYHKIQLASYMKMYYEKHGVKYSGVVVKFGNSEITSETVTWEEVDRYWNEIVRRSIYCANQLDKKMAEQDLKSHPEKGGGLYSFT